MSKVSNEAKSFSLKLKRKFTTKYIAYLAVFVSLSVVLNFVSIPLLSPSNKLTFTYIPCFLSGIFLGPIAGFLTGFLGDLLGFLIKPDGAYMPLISVANGLMGLIPGLVFLIKKLNPYIGIAVSLVLVFIVCTCGLNTYSLYLLYGLGKKTFWVYLSGRLINGQAIMFAVNAVLIYLLYIPFRKFIFKKR